MYIQSQIDPKKQKNLVTLGHPVPILELPTLNQAGRETYFGWKHQPQP